MQIAATATQKQRSTDNCDASGSAPARNHGVTSCSLRNSTILNPNGFKVRW